MKITIEVPSNLVQRVQAMAQGEIGRQFDGEELIDFFEEYTSELFFDATRFNSPKSILKAVASYCECQFLGD